MAATTTNTTNSAGGVVGVAPTGVEAYEDMFKEITRKLYGEEFRIYKRRPSIKLWVAQ